VFVCETIKESSMLRLIRQDCGLDEDVDNHRFDLGVERSVVETEQVLVMVCMINS
jgi:hypothetical protein